MNTFSTHEGLELLRRDTSLRVDGDVLESEHRRASHCASNPRAGKGTRVRQAQLPLHHILPAPEQQGPRDLPAARDLTGLQPAQLYLLRALPPAAVRQRERRRDDQLTGLITPDGSEWRYRYDALGRRIARSTDEQFYAIVTDLVGAPTELLRFPGQYADPESGLNYNYFRYYDPETARYLSADPVGLAGGYAPHSYVPNPLTWLDSLGLSLLDVIKNGVRILVHEYDADKPAHAHVTGGGREVRIGPNGHPIDGQPELSRTQRQVVENYKTEIRKAVRKLGRRNQAEEREQREAKTKPCDK